MTGRLDSLRNVPPAHTPEEASGGPMAALLPQAVLGPLGGTLGDHYNRRLLTITANVMSALCMLVPRGFVLRAVRLKQSPQSLPAVAVPRWGRWRLARCSSAGRFRLASSRRCWASGRCCAFAFLSPVIGMLMAAVAWWVMSGISFVLGNAPLTALLQTTIPNYQRGSKWKSLKPSALF